MKILIISYYYLLKDSTGSLRARAMEKFLPKNGIDVAVLTYRAQKEPVTFCDNVVGVRDITRQTVPLPLFYLLRIWQKTMRWLGIYRGLCSYWRETALTHSDEIIERIKPDLILASYPCVEALEIGTTLARKYGLPLISDFRDGLLFEPLDPDVTRHQIVYRYYQQIEARVVATSKLIIAVSDPISTYFEKRYSHSNVTTLQNGFDSDDVGVNSNLILPADVVNIVHTGRVELSRRETAGKGRGVDALKTSLNLLLVRLPDLSKKINIHFIGELSGSEKNDLAFFIQTGVVKLWGHQPRATAINFQRKADILLLITAPDKASIATGKLFEYLAANKPILALTRGTAAENIIVETGSGIVVSPDDPEAIAKALEAILEKNGEIFTERNEALITTYSREQQMMRLASKMKAL